MEKPIHICIITCAHQAGDVRVNHKIGQAFLAEGFRVSAVGPGLALSDSSQNDGSEIEYQLFSPGKGKSGRLLHSFKAYKSARSIPDVQVFYAPDPDAAVAAICLAKMHRARVIFDIHEMYHNIMLDHWLKGPLGKIGKGILRSILSKVCSACDLVIGVNQSVLEPYQSTIKEKMVIRSCAPAWFAEGGQADVCGSGKKTFTFMHGQTYLLRGTDVVMKALGLAKKQVPGLKCLMFETFAGSPHEWGAAEFHRQVDALDLRDVLELRQRVPLEEIPAILRTCDAGLIAYGRKLGADSLPNRLFEYLAAGLPVMAPSYSPEIRRIVELENCGVSVDFEDPVSIAEKMVFMYQNPQICREMGHRAREAFEQRHNWEVEVRPLLNRIRSWYPDFG